MKFSYLMAHDQKQQEIADVTIPNHMSYANKWGHRFIYRKIDWNKDRNGMWMKWHFILDVLNSSLAGDTDWFFWADTDTLIMNHSLPLEELLSNAPSDKNFIFSKWYIPFSHSFINLNGKIKKSTIDRNWFTVHTGNFFIRNCEWSRNFIRNLISDDRFLSNPDIREHVTGDEIGVTIYYKGYKEYRDKIGFLPIDSVHTIDHSMKKPHIDLKVFERGDFIFHASFLPISEKIKMLNRYKELAVGNDSPA